MDLKDFKIKLEDIHSRIKSELTDEINNRKPILDGVVYAEKYLKAPIKILWLLKEAYDGDNGTGGGWDFEWLLGEGVKEFILSHGSKATWHPIVYVSYSLQNGFPLWDDMNYIRDMPEMTYSVQSVAFINALKLPAMHGTKSYNSEIEKEFLKTKNFNEEQIKLLEPQVIIAGSTLHLYKDILGLNDLEYTVYRSVHYYIKGDKLIIDAYHPGQRGVKRQNYVDDIITVVKNWKEKISKTHS
ncbi:MAG: hypothetical protein WD048_06070 [Chitinophagales bacterium]